MIDGIIIKDEVRRIALQHEVSLQGKDIIIVQAKASRLGMNVMGQAFFTTELMRAFNPRSIVSVALVLKDDAILRPLLERHEGMQVVVCPGVP